MKTILKISAVAMAAAMLAAAPASAATITVGGDGGLLNLGGGTGSTVNANVDTGGGTNANLDVNLNDPNADTATLDLGNTLGNGGTRATVDLGGADSNGNLVNLFGSGDPTTATVNLGGSGGTDGAVLLDLFGSGADGSAASVALNGGADGLGGAGVLGNDATIDLFGPADGGTGGTGISGSNGGTINGRGTAALRVASLTNIPGQCFAPNTTQIAKLTTRHTYGEATFSTWAGADSLKVVDVNLCSSAGAAISGDGNVGRLQSFVDSNTVLKAKLGQLGHSPNDVIAVDRTGKTLTVYVM